MAPFIRRPEVRPEGATERPDGQTAQRRHSASRRLIHHRFLLIFTKHIIFLMLFMRICIFIFAYVYELRALKHVLNKLFNMPLTVNVWPP